MVIEDLMTHDPVALDANAPVLEAIAMLKRLDVRHLPVLNAGQLVGMLSDRDLPGAPGALESDADVEAYAESLRAPVVERMSASPITVGPDDELTEAIDMMLEHRIGAVPVVDPHEARLVGIVSYVDVLRALRERA